MGSNESYDMIIHLLDSYCLDTDMTPIDGEKLRIADMNGVNDVNGVEEKKEEPSMAQKVSSGFSKLTSSVSQKFMSLGVKDEHHEIKGLESSVEDDKVPLQSAKRKSKSKGKAPSGNDAKY